MAMTELDVAALAALFIAVAVSRASGQTVAGSVIAGSLLAGGYSPVAVALSSLIIVVSTLFDAKLWRGK